MSSSPAPPSRLRRASVALALALASLPALFASPGGAAGTASAARRPGPPPAVGFPVVPGVYRLDGTDPDLPAADLEPLRRIVGKAEIVALGESEHTVGSYFEAKHRIIRFLVEKMGFRAFALENNWEVAEPLGRYIETCEGTPEEALRSVYPAWQSTEMRDLAQWMCEWNRNHTRAADRIRFFSFDVQQPFLDGRALLTFLARLGFSADHPWVTAVNGCAGVSGSGARTITDEAYAACVAALDAIGGHFDRNARTITRQTSATDLALARLRLTGLRAWQGEVHFPLDQAAHWESRDNGMAMAFRALRDLHAPKARTVIWAHNAHIWKSPHPYYYDSRMMGSRLREIYGPRYVSIGLVGWNVEIDDEDFCGPFEETPADSVEAHLESLGQDFLLADLLTPATPPFFDPRQTYGLSYAQVTPRFYFDALVWIRHARKMEPLFRPPCR
jgi:erythromycin esterase